MKGSQQLGEYLRFLRGSDSQETFGSKLGVHRTYVSKAETGEFTPPQDIFLKWFELGHERFKQMQVYATVMMAAEQQLQQRGA